MSQTLEVLSLLAEMDITKDLPQAAREELAAHCGFGEVPAKQRIRLTESGGQRLFLVDGHLVRLTDGSGERFQSFRGLSDPIEVFDGVARGESMIVTESPCLLLKVSSAALESAQQSGLEVSDIELDATEGEFLAELYGLISSNRLELPARPEVAFKIQELTNDPEAGIVELTEVIQSDGTIAGALLHATNSPLFRATKQIQSVRDAVLRLGFRNTRMLTTNLALRQAFKARHVVTREAMQQVWADGVLCSAYSYLLAETLGLLHRERALLAGLVAGIGAVPIIQFIEMRDPDPSPELIASLVDKLSGITGVLVINYWGLGEDLVAVAEHSHDWSYVAPEPDYASIAIVARWAALQSEGREHPEASQVPAFATLGLTPPAPGEPIGELASSTETLESLKMMFDV
ncbi:HDOD domain-containing protein [Marichromatium gracile]|uniref:Histidine kinase n=1 Tax=Marichromatium gracile TaxID=1048 RepID=A0ABR5VI67_MARGR|nr:HDOD domain-containing protein [Marichromatium gracile]KXX65381.1 histidine kinase [Marichromatium gracile]